MTNLTATATWRRLLAKILGEGRDVHQDDRAHEPRDRDTREIVACQSVWNMATPAVRCPARKVGRKFSVAEPAWILSGSNELEWIARYAPHLKTFSDDGIRLNGAYGPPFVDQLPYVTACLAADPQSRQVVATLWRPRPMVSRDIPCTVALQWLLRDGALHCSTYMRSSDAWLGIVYDVVAFSAMSAAVAVELNARKPGEVAELGELTVTSGSQHLYRRDWLAAAECARAIPDVPDVDQIVLGRYAKADDLVREFRDVLNGQASRVAPPWLGDL